MKRKLNNPKILKINPITDQQARFIENLSDGKIFIYKYVINYYIHILDKNTIIKYLLDTIKSENTNISRFKSKFNMSKNVYKESKNLNSLNSVPDQIGFSLGKIKAAQFVLNCDFDLNLIKEQLHNELNKQENFEHQYF